DNLGLMIGDAGLDADFFRRIELVAVLDGVDQPLFQRQADSELRLHAESMVFNLGEDALLHHAAFLKLRGDVELQGIVQRSCPSIPTAHVRALLKISQRLRAGWEYPEQPVELGDHEN